MATNKVICYPGSTSLFCLGMVEFNRYRKSEGNGSKKARKEADEDFLETNPVVTPLAQ